jgi:hypothetical protein
MKTCMNISRASRPKTVAKATRPIRSGGYVFGLSLSQGHELYMPTLDWPKVSR